MNMHLPPPDTLGGGELIQVNATEPAFLEMALADLQTRSFGAFLDSAGPLNARSRLLILSKSPRGLVIQSENRLVYHDFRHKSAAKVAWSEFSEWLQSFAALGHTHGPALFPLFTYEAFQDRITSTAPHPLWLPTQAIWLLSENPVYFDRHTQQMTYRKATLPEVHGSLPLPPLHPLPGFGWRESRESYRAKVEQVQHDIYNGVYYQANLSQRYLGRTYQPPLETYRNMRHLNPSPFMGVFRLHNAWTLSGSPERLVYKSGTRLSSRPIAGTKPRFGNPVDDQHSKRDLQTSTKERAEHLMLVDLLRNDLGRIAEAGSVTVPEFESIESYSHVHHLVSEVCARARPNLILLDLIRAVFPGGTITGAPKISCIKRLAELEGEARGPYTGSMGYINSNQGLDLNILIRTLIRRDDLFCFHGGGGIVADSLFNAEYLESRQKCKALMQALGVEA